MLDITFQMPTRHSKLSMQSFEIIRVVGKGNFGKVLLVKKIDTQRIYAIKALTKKHLVDKGGSIHFLYFLPLP